MDSLILEYMLATIVVQRWCDPDHLRKMVENVTSLDNVLLASLVHCGSDRDAGSRATFRDFCVIYLLLSYAADLRAANDREGG